MPHVELIELPPIEVVCLRHDGPVATIGQTFRTLMRMLHTGQALPGTPERIGICCGDPEVRDTFRYYAAAAVPPARGLPSACWSRPASKAASTPATGWSARMP